MFYLYTTKVYLLGILNKCIFKYPPPNIKTHKYSIKEVKINKGTGIIMALEAPLGFASLVSTLSVNSFRRQLKIFQYLTLSLMFAVTRGACTTTDGNIKRYGFRSYFPIKVQRTLMREPRLE